MPRKLPLTVRRALAAVLSPFHVRIRSGPNQGARWSLAAAGRHAAGSFEAERMQLLRVLVREGNVFWDVGAHHGYVTLLASGLVGQDGRVYSFEPSGYNHYFLQRHVAMNRLCNVEVRKVGLGARNEVVSFGGGASSQALHVGGGRERVSLTTIPDLLRAGVPAPDVLKVDVEGSEADILEAGAQHLPGHCIAVIALHHREARDRSIAALVAAGFEVIESNKARYWAQHERWGEDPDIVALGQDRRDLADKIRRLPAFSG
ncbi:MAG: FkbM family methyltransferase [Gemmatimonadota bacterium]